MNGSFPILRRAGVAALLLFQALICQTKAQEYLWTTFAGNRGGPGQNDGTGPAARFDGPVAAAVTAGGVIYVADQGNHTIRRITPDGTVTTFAGMPQISGSANGTGSAARFSGPSGICAGADGNFYVTDTGSHTIRRITPAALVSTFAGSPGQSGTANGTGGNARFRYPRSICADGAGNLYVAEAGSYTVRKITPAGVVSTLAGNPDQPGSTNGTGTAARFSEIQGITVDAAGASIYVSDTTNHTVRKITAAGVVSTWAGTAGSAGGADGNGGSARFEAPHGLALDASGNLFVADYDNWNIRKIDPSRNVTSFAGSAGSVGVAGYVNATGSAARFYRPGGLAFGPSGDLYVAESGNDAVRKISPAAVVSTLAGGPGETGSVDGTGVNARFDWPGAVAVDAAGNVFVADTYNNAIRKITPAGVVTTIAGTPGANLGYVDGTGAAARFWSPTGIVVTPDGTLYVSDTGNDVIRKITPAGVVTTFAGRAGTSGSTDGTGSAARFFSPRGMVLGPDGNIYLADHLNATIRRITLSAVVTTFAGRAGVTGSADGSATNARFNYFNNLAADPAGNLYVADTANITIRKVTPAGIVSTIAGKTGVTGLDDGPGAAALFVSPMGITVDRSGNLFVLDGSQPMAVRKITPAYIVSTVGGIYGVTGIGDGVGSQALFSGGRGEGHGMATGPDGAIYAADAGGARIVRGVPYVPEIAVFAGSRESGTELAGGQPAPVVWPDVRQASAPEPERIITIWNSGVAPLNITAITLSPAWSLAPPTALPAVIAPGATLPLTVRLSTAAAGSFAGTITIQSNDADEASFDFPVAGKVITPEITVRSGDTTGPELADSQAAPVDFGTTRQPVPVVRRLVIGNAGTAPLLVSSITVPPGYTLLAPSALPATVAIDAFLTMDLRLDAAALGTFAGSVVIASDDLDEPSFDFPVTGTAVSPEIAVHNGDAVAPELTDGQATAVDLGRNVQGTPGTRTFTIANTGTADLLVSALTAPAGYELQGLPPLPFTISIGQVRSFQVSLATHIVGTHSGSVVITSDDLDEANFDFPVSGEVFIPDPVATPPATTAAALSRQTGLREQTIHLTNDTTATVPAYNLIIRGLPAGVEVNNASRQREDGSWVVYVRQTMNPHTSQNVLLEYFSPTRLPAEFTPQLSTEVVLQPADLSVPREAEAFRIDVVKAVPGGLLIEFPTSPGRRYQVQYSGDGTNWQSSLPSINAAANRTQWVDRGLPRTENAPGSNTSRFYRVVILL